MSLTTIMTPLRGVLTSLLVLGAALAHAQAPGPADDAARRQAEILQRQEQQRLDQQQQRLQTPALPPATVTPSPATPGADTASVVKGPCVQIQRIALEGAELLDEWETAELVDAYRERCLAAADIEQLMGAVTQTYIARGFTTTRTYLPNQNLKTGRLLVVVLEGRIEALKVEGDPQGRINLGTTVAAGPGDLLNVRDLEQAVDQINTVPGNNVKLDIRPGSKPGQSIVVFRNQASSNFRFGVSADNQGSTLTGRNGLGISLRVGSMLGLGETISATAHTTEPFGGADYARNVSLGFRIPVDYNTFGASIGRSEYSATLFLPSGRPLQITGSTATQSLTYERMLMRDNSSLHSLVASLDSSNALNYVGGQLIRVNSRKINSLTIGLRSTYIDNKTLWVVNPNVTMGLSRQNNLPAGVNPSGSGAQAEFTRYGINVLMQHPFTIGAERFSWTSQLVAQYSSRALFGSQKFLVGSASTVHGFYDTSLNGDSGFVWRNELAWHYRVPVGASTLDGRLYVGFDTGRVSSRLTGGDSGRSTGVVVGAAGSIDEASFDINWSRALRVPSTLQREPSRVQARLGLDF